MVFGHAVPLLGRRLCLLRRCETVASSCWQEEMLHGVLLASGLLHAGTAEFLSMREKFSPIWNFGNAMRENFSPILSFETINRIFNRRPLKIQLQHVAHSTPATPEPLTAMMFASSAIAPSKTHMVLNANPTFSNLSLPWVHPCG